MGLLFELLSATQQPGLLDSPTKENLENWGIVNDKPILIDFPKYDNDDNDKEENHNV